MRIGFIGCGNMAKPIIRGLIRKGSICGETLSVYVYDIMRDMLREFCAAAGAVAVDSYADVVENCDVVVLAVKPQVFPELLPELADGLKKHRPFIVSIAAGKTTEYIASFFDHNAAVGRIFPNLNAEVGQSVSAYCANENVPENGKEILRGICESFGTAFELEEALFPVFGVLSGCAPAYTFMYIGALARAAEENGLDAAMALRVASRMAIGSAMTLEESGEKPGTLIGRVCSPGGTTIEGITYLHENGFEDTLKNAFRASYEKDKRI